MKRKINEVFEDQGVKVKCVESANLVINCKKCFYTKRIRCNRVEDITANGLCGSVYRSDFKNVYFIQVPE